MTHTTNTQLTTHVCTHQHILETITNRHRREKTCILPALQKHIYKSLSPTFSHTQHEYMKMVHCQSTQTHTPHTHAHTHTRTHTHAHTHTHTHTHLYHHGGA